MQLNDAISGAEKIIDFLDEKLLPFVEKLASKIYSIIKDLAADEIKTSDLRSNLIACKEHIDNMLNYAAKYLEDIDEFLSYADLDKDKVSRMKNGYKMLIEQEDSTETKSLCSVQVISAVAVGVMSLGLFTAGTLPAIGAISVGGTGLAAVYFIFRDSKKEDIKGLKRFLHMLALFTEGTVKTYSEFEYHSRLAKDGCEDALQLCDIVWKTVQNSKKNAEVIKTVAIVATAASLGVAGAAVGALAVATTAGKLIGIGVASAGVAGGSGALAAIADSTAKKYKKISQDLDVFIEDFRELQKIVTETSRKVKPVKVQMESLEQKRLYVDDHTKKNRDYDSFCSLLDMMLTRAKRAKEKNARAKQQIDNILSGIDL